MTPAIWAIALGIALGLGYFAVRAAALRHADRLVAAHRGKRCPTCRARALETTHAVLENVRDDRGAWRPNHVTHYGCAHCTAEFRQLNRGPLIPAEAWQAGAREAIPAARVVERQ